MDRFRIVGQRDVFGRRLVRVQPVRMRVVDAKKFEPTLAEFPQQTRNLLGRNYVISDRIRRDVLGRKRLRDYVVLPRQNSATVPMRLAARMRQKLPKHFPPASDSSLHSGSL